MKLRPHQELAIQMCRESFARGNKRIMLAAPCSFGKTITAIHMMVNAASRGKRVLFVCDRIKLVEQTLAACDRYGIDVGVLQADHWRTDTRKQIQIASVHTLARKKHVFRDFDFMIIDEAHVLYQTLKDYMDKASAVPVVALSATPFSKGLGKYFKTSSFRSRCSVASAGLPRTCSLLRRQDSRCQQATQESNRHWYQIITQMIWLAHMKP